MDILLTAATEMEISPFREAFFRKNNVSFLVTGVGMVSTAYELARHFSTNRYDLAVNIGLAGSFDRSIPIGEVVRVIEDIFSELGAEDGDQFLSISHLGLEATNILVNVDDFRPQALKHFRSVRSITVNTVHGRESTIEEVVSRLNPQTESMEGAAFFYVCGRENIPSLQLRAISNYVERRNKLAWDIPLAMKNLKQEVVALIERL